MSSNEHNLMNVPIGFKVKYIYHILLGCITYLAQRNTFTESMIIRLYGEDSIDSVPITHKNFLFRELLLSVEPKDIPAIKQEFENNVRIQQLEGLFSNSYTYNQKFGMFFKLDSISKKHIHKFNHILNRGELVEIIISNFILSLSDSEFDLIEDIFKHLMKDKRYTDMLD